MLVSSVLLAFGLAVLYSASALVAMNENHNSAFYLLRQLTGAAAGVVAFAIVAKVDAEKWRDWAWPLMLITIVTMLLTLVLPDSIAPRINGSRRCEDLRDAAVSTSCWRRRQKTSQRAQARIYGSTWRRVYRWRRTCARISRASSAKRYQMQPVMERPRT